MVNEELLIVRNISMAFGWLSALDEVSFNLYKEEILGIVGPNDAGYRIEA